MCGRIRRKYQAFHQQRRLHINNNEMKKPYDRCCDLRGYPNENHNLPYQLERVVDSLSETIKTYERIPECLSKLSDEDIKQLRMNYKIKKTENDVKELNIDDDETVLTVDLVS